MNIHFHKLFKATTVPATCRANTEASKLWLSKCKRMAWMSGCRSSIVGLLVNYIFIFNTYCQAAVNETIFTYTPKQLLRGFLKLPFLQFHNSLIFKGLCPPPDLLKGSVTWIFNIFSGQNFNQKSNFLLIAPTAMKNFTIFRGRTSGPPPLKRRGMERRQKLRKGIEKEESGNKGAVAPWALRWK